VSETSAEDEIAGLEQALQLISIQFARGKVVPFLGAGANLSGDSPPPPGARRLPTTEELEEELASSVGYPHDGGSIGLAKMSQLYAALLGPEALTDFLIEEFDDDYAPGPVHQMLARLTARLAAHSGQPSQLIVTTNYDDVLERAFADENLPVHVVSYVSQAGHARRGGFVHQPPSPDGASPPIEIDTPDEYDAVDPETQIVILKVHGSVVRDDPDPLGFVITEDDYVEYLAIQRPTGFLPIKIAKHLKRRHLLMMGYSLSDWNLRVLLEPLRGQQLKWKGWAVQRQPSDVELKVWDQRGIEILDCDLHPFVDALEKGVHAELGERPADHV
jgi:hypothetical protein